MNQSGKDRIDRAIDEAARGLTAGEPGAAFTMRVLARVRRRPAAWSWRVMNPLSVAAVIAIAFVALVMRMSNVRPAVTPQPAPAIADAGSPKAPPDAPVLSPEQQRAMATLLESNLQTQTDDARLKPSRSPAQSKAALSQSQRALSQPQGAPSRLQPALSRSRRAPSASGGTPSFVASLAPPPLDVPSIVLPSLDAGASLDVPALVPLAPIVLAPLDQPEGDHP